MDFKITLVKILVSVFLLTQINTLAFCEEKDVSPAKIFVQVTENDKSKASETKSDIIFKNDFPDKNWWLKFNDRYLTRCIEEALRSNLDLALAKERIQESKALAKQSLGREFPQISLGSSYTRENSENTVINPILMNNYLSFPIDVNYELDIWHKNRDNTKAANKQAEATSQSYQATNIALITNVASSYFNLLNDDQLIALQKAVIHVAELDLAHTQRCYEAGLTDDEEVVIKHGNLTNYKAQLQNYYQLQSLAEHQLAILMGKSSAQLSKIEREDWDSYKIPTEVNAGVSSDIIARRPDIQAAEDQLGAAGFLASSARKQLLPSINLSGDFGYSNTKLANLFNWDSFITGFTGGLSQDLFTGGQRRANLKVYKSRYAQQLITYHSTILKALQEIDDSTALLNSDKISYTNYESSLTSLRQRLKIQQNRLDAGSISEADINPELLEIYLAQEGLAKSKLATLTDVISLYKALGGGY